MASGLTNRVFDTRILNIQYLPFSQSFRPSITGLRPQKITHLHKMHSVSSGFANALEARPSSGVQDSLRARIKNGEAVYGTLITVPAPEVAEALSLAGFDFLWIDCEHSPIDMTAAQRLIMSVGGRCPCLIRVPANSEVWIKKALDTGCEGIIVPQVKTAAEARAVVSASLYPPQGARSVGISRSQGYGTTFNEYVESANANMLIVAQVEHIDAANNLDEILEVPGIDVIFVGPYDLSGSMSMLGRVEHPDVEKVIDDVRDKCATAGRAVGFFAVDGAGGLKAVKKGFKFVAVGMDTHFLIQKAKSELDTLRKSKTE